MTTPMATEQWIASNVSFFFFFCFRFNERPLCVRVSVHTLRPTHGHAARLYLHLHTTYAKPRKKNKENATFSRNFNLQECLCVCARALEPVLRLHQIRLL